MQFSQMFFAMLGDKIIFGYTPDLKALLGSGLIISGVIFMVLQKAPKSDQRRRDDEGVGSGGVRGGGHEDEESRTGLLSEEAVRDVETGEDHDRILREEEEGRAER